MKSVSRIAARIDLDAIEENFRQMRANIEEGTRMVAVIKADGYGHGAVRIARLVEHYDYLWDLQLRQRKKLSSCVNTGSGSQL